MPASPRRAVVPGRGRAGYTRPIVLASVGAVLLVAAATAALAMTGHHAGNPRAGQSPKATTKPSATASTPAPPRVGLVTVGAGAVSGPHEKNIASVLNRYFTAINDHDYAAYQLLFSPAQRGGLTPAAFTAGYGSSTDSAIMLESIAPAVTDGELAAQVSFTSHQQPAASPTDSACTDWTISLYLAKQDGRWLMQSPPAGYQAQFRACA